MNFLKKISESQITELHECAEKTEDLATLRRIQAIIMLEGHISANMIKATTGYQREVVVKLRRKYLKHGISALISKRRKKAPKTLLNRNQKDQIVVVLNTKTPKDFGLDSDFWTATILGQLIREQYGVQYKSKTSLYLIFKRAEFTFHKPEKRSEKHNDKQIVDWKEEYKPIIQEECEALNTIVLAGDEASLTSETRLQRVWLPVEKDAFVQDTTNRKRTHIYGFLNVQSGVATAFQTKKETGETTVEILKKLAKLYTNKRIVIFWDNASWHKSKEVRAYLDSTQQFKLYNFPPYAPELNPQEHVWKEMREKVLNNTHITNIDKAAKEATEFINNSIFKYKFTGVHGTFNM